MNERDKHLLSALVDGEADDGELRGLLGPVDASSRLSDSLLHRHAILRTLSSAIRRSAVRYQAPAHLRASVMRMTATRAPERRSVWNSWAARFAVPVLATALLSSTVTVLLTRSAESDSFEAQLASAHLRTLITPNPVDVTSSDQHTVKPWFAGKINYAPPVEDFSAQGFALMGGRIEVFGGEPVSALLYQYKKHMINLYVLPARLGRALTSTGSTQRNGFNIVTQADREFVYIAISDLNPAELNLLPQLITKPVVQ